jgi:hypothetical protein
MDFEYACSIHISEDDLNYMAKEVTKGEDFPDVFENVICGYDDADYYNSGYFFDSVEAEINKRVEELKKKEAEKPQLSKETMQAINNYLSEVIANSYRCAHCSLKHGEEKPFCFFAYECIKDDFSKWREDD